MLAGKPDPPLRQAHPHRRDIILEVDLLLFLLSPAPPYLPSVVTVRHWFASPHTDPRVDGGSIPCQVIAMPVRGENRGGGTVSVAGLILGKKAVIWAGKVVDSTKMLGDIGLSPRIKENMCSAHGLWV